MASFFDINTDQNKITVDDLPALVDMAWDYFRRVEPFGGPDVDPPIEERFAVEIREYIIKKLAHILYEQETFGREIHAECLSKVLLEDRWTFIEYIETVADPEEHYEWLLKRDRIEREAESKTNAVPPPKPPAPRQWLWQPYIPQGAITVLAGQPGVGKSSLALAIAAQVTNATLLPDPESVLLVLPEDADKAAVTAQFVALNGDPDKLHLSTLNLDAKTPDVHPAMIEKAMNEHTHALVIIDPMSAFTATSNASSAAARCNTYRKLAKIASNKRCAILLVANRVRANGRGPLVQTIEDAAVLAPIARSVLVAGKAPNRSNQNVLLHVKSNYAKLGDALAFSIDGQGFAWVDNADSKGDARPDGPPTQLEIAMNYLKHVLKDGPQSANAILQDAPCGLSTLKLAKERLNIVATKSRTVAGAWLWELPANEDDAMDNVDPANDLEEVGKEVAGTNTNP